MLIAQILAQAAEGVTLWRILTVVVYLGLVGYLGWLGWRHTRTTTDYLVAGRQVHPFIMAMSYGATFISTSAIVGFGGVAGLFGMSVLWLTFLNIFAGIFLAFVFIAPFTRKMGHHLDAHTFPELLGKRFNSKFIQVFSGLVIFLFIPLYAAAVLIGGCEFIAVEFSIDFETALLVFSVIIAAYVIFGGLKGVMYTDALQGSIMFVAMLILVGGVYYSMGGITSAHQSLTDLADMVPSKLQAIGHRGWTAMPEFGFGEVKYNLWWIMVSTIILGVGIGVLAQPQLAVRFMTVKSRRELNRAVMIGGIFILLMTGGAFTVGSLSNAWFTQRGPELKGQVTQVINEEKGHAVIEWTVTTADGKEEVKNAPVVLSEGKAVLGESVKGRSISVVYAKGNSDQIIPLFINQAMPAWFRLLFLLTLLAAAMSTLSSQFHTLGTAISRDVYGQLLPKGGQGIGITRLGILIGIVLAVVISYYNRGGGYFIARATAIFFGLCVSTFLPAYLGGLFTKWVSRPAAIASMIVGFLATAFWLTFVKSAEAGVIGLVQKVTGGKTSILEDHLNWPNVDPIVIALPLSIITVVIFSLIFRPKDELKSLEGMPS